MSKPEEKNDVVSLGEVLDTDKTYTLRQLCDICQITEIEVFRFMEFNVIDTETDSEMVFRQAHLDRLLKGVRLQRDLELNHAGIALALDLLETIEHLKQEIRLLRIRSRTLN